MTDKRNTQKGIREIIRNKEYQIDLRKYGAGEPKFFGTAAEASHYRQQKIAELDVLSKSNVKIQAGSVQTACDQFLKEQKRRWKEDGEIGHGEYVNKERHCRQFCAVPVENKTIGDLQLADLTKKILVNVVKKHLLIGRSKSTVRRAFVTYKQMLKWCVDEGYIAQSPAAGIVISLKNETVPDLRRITPAEMVIVINAAPEKYRREIMFAAYTGLRAGEQAVLTWDDIDFDYSYVRIDKARKWGGELGGPKTIHSQREVKLSKTVLNMLREWKMQQPLQMRTNNLVFPTEVGSVADTNNWRNRGLFPACAAAEFEGRPVAPMKWHDLRHFYASVLIFGKQVDGAELAALLGHGSVEFTYKVYARYYRDLKRDQETGDVLDQAFETGQYQAISGRA